MFKRGLNVVAREVRVLSTTESTAVVEFRQYWQSATYADQGIKVLKLRHDGKSWRITEEEMKNSSRWDRVLP